MNTRPKIIVGLLTSLLCALAARADDNLLVITEVSSTTLTAAYNGTPLSVVFRPGPGHDAELWDISGVPLSGNSYLSWYEPDGSGRVNYLEVSGGTYPFVRIWSDYEPLPWSGPMADGALQTLNMGFHSGDSPYPGSIGVEFHDLGDSVPDSGSTGLMLLLSISALAKVRRRRLS